MKKTKRATKTKKTTRAGKAKASRKRSAVKKKVPAKKAAAVRGGLPAVQKVREAAAQPQSLPTEPATPTYSKTQL